jgi:hypothetical protein
MKRAGADNHWHSPGGARQTNAHAVPDSRYRLEDKMTQWEYLVLTIGVVDHPSSIEDILNERGSAGWELVSAVHVEIYKGIVIFKRRKDEH